MHLEDAPDTVVLTISAEDQTCGREWRIQHPFSSGPIGRIPCSYQLQWFAEYVRALEEAGVEGLATYADDGHIFGDPPHPGCEALP